MTEVLHNPAFSTIMEMSIDQDENPLAPLTLYFQQMVLGRKVSRAVQGDGSPLVNTDIVQELSRRQMGVYIQSVFGFHTMVHGLALHFKTSRDKMAATLPDMPAADVALPLFQDYLSLSGEGFLDDGGVKDSYHQAAMRLRMLSTVLLLSPHAHDSESVGQVFDQLYKVSGERWPVNEQDVDLYIQELSREASSGRRLQKLNRRFGARSIPLLHRATEGLLIGTTKSLFLGMTPEQIDGARQAYRNALGAMVGSDIERLHKTATAIELEMAALRTAELPEIVEQIVEASYLDWEALPPGELEQHAREIVAQNMERMSTPPTIDLARLRTLSSLRTALGESRCYFARGKLGARRKVKADGVEQADQYLLLVWRDLDDQGNLRGESVVAESPIAGEHALYVFRHDVSGDNWRSAMALPKSVARDLGARRVRHVIPVGETDLVATMTRKALALLTCPPEEFSILKFAGAQGVRVPRAALPELPQA